MHAKKIFDPKLLTTLKDYTLEKFLKDLIAGIIVGIVALPLAIAFGIASGVTPEQGLITSIIAGFIISFLGGSRVQIGGPTGAFIVIVFGIVQQHGVAGLTIATIMAGIILIAMGLARLGTWIKFIPTSVIVGFTSGIAAVIFSSQIKDFFGMHLNSVPADFLSKWGVYFNNLETTNIYALGTSVSTVIIIASISKKYPKVPGAFVALTMTTIIAYIFKFPIDTIGSRFGDISMVIPEPSIPSFSFATIKELMVPAITIALLGAIESLLSAVVADGMIGGRHRSNTELIAQGIANIVAPIFGGIPATGAIARTATNVRNGGRTPVSGIVHAITLLLILICLAPMAKLIPMATLAGILVVVSYNMSEWREFKELLKAPKGDVAVLLLTFFLTVIFDLVIAIEVGMILSTFIFMAKMADNSKIAKYRSGESTDKYADKDEYYNRPTALSQLSIPENVEIFEIRGAFFFGAASKFEDILRTESSNSDYIILRLNQVSILDATGLKVLTKFANEAMKRNCKILLAELNADCINTIIKSKKTDIFGEENIFPSLELAVKSTIP